MVGMLVYSPVYFAASGNGECVGMVVAANQHKTPTPRTPSSALNPDDRDAWETESDADKQYRTRLLAKLQASDQKGVRTQMETLVPAMESLERAIMNMRTYVGAGVEDTVEEVRNSRHLLLQRSYMLYIAQEMGYGASERYNSLL